MNTIARADSIRDRLSRHWLTVVEVAVSPMPIEDWELAAIDLGPHARFGLAWPMPWKDAELIVPFCPELIDRVTESLTDDDLDAYLGAIEFLIDVEISHILDGLSREAAVIQAEDHLAEIAGGSLELLSDTQAAALDRGVGR